MHAYAKTRDCCSALFPPLNICHVIETFVSFYDLTIDSRVEDHNYPSAMKNLDLIIINIIVSQKTETPARHERYFAHLQRDFRSKQRERVRASFERAFEFFADCGNDTAARENAKLQRLPSRSDARRPRRSNVIRLSVLRSVTCPRTVALVIAIIISGGARVYRQLFPTRCKNKPRHAS